MYLNKFRDNQKLINECAFTVRAFRRRQCFKAASSLTPGTTPTPIPALPKSGPKKNAAVGGADGYPGNKLANCWYCWCCWPWAELRCWWWSWWCVWGGTLPRLRISSIRKDVRLAEVPFWPGCAWACCWQVDCIFPFIFRKNFKDVILNNLEIVNWSIPSINYIPIACNNWKLHIGVIFEMLRTLQNTLEHCISSSILSLILFDAWILKELINTNTLRIQQKKEHVSLSIKIMIPDIETHT